ncbi:carboxymuconolactone decarboxylase family protein [Apibacter raozihei]|uniref:carboxymuconolactone decarboxylase family protein n=1 Tax=Apibacter raozihei TaxID=2500547 RepID=UPI000FE3311F|nr:carboxymuconolactone decarboxylase family protein [Apibacter raozihei]
MRKNGLIILITIICFTCGYNEAKAQNGISNNMRTKNLDLQQEKTVTIAAFVARGELNKLKIELSAGLDAGLTVNEIKEMIVQAYAYCGFPRSIRGLQTLMSVLEKRKANGSIDSFGKEASPIIDVRPKYERGKEILAELSGVAAPEGRPTNGYGAFSPEIDTFLKEHLFADIFERDVLTYAQREMVTVSILMSLDGVEPMLSSHINLALNVGITPDQLYQMTQIISNNVDPKNGDIAKSILTEVLKNRDLQLNN